MARVLLTEQDFHDLATAYLARARLAGVVRVELFFDPQAHIERGVPLAVVIGGLSSAARDAAAGGGPTVGLIACILRDRSPQPAGRTTYRRGAGRTPRGTPRHRSGLSRGRPPAEYVRGRIRTGWRARSASSGACRRGGTAGLHLAGLDLLGAERIDHGIRAVEDRALLARLANDDIPLTVCPLSNVRLQCVEQLGSHPLPALLAAGVAVTINSDDPAYFGGYIAENYLAVATALPLGREELGQLASASLKAAFSPLPISNHECSGSLQSD